jgi:hypothetical protein
LDFRLEDNALIFEKIPEFVPPEFETMGLVDDPRRASPAVRFGEGVSALVPLMTPEERAD